MSFGGEGSMTLGELTERLEACPLPPVMVCRYGFKKAHSYRGYYEDLAFELALDVTLASMINCVKMANGVVFEGWKGGDFLMGPNTDCWLVPSAGQVGVPFLPVYLAVILGEPLTQYLPWYPLSFIKDHT